MLRLCLRALGHHIHHAAGAVLATHDRRRAAQYLDAFKRIRLVAHIAIVASQHQTHAIEQGRAFAAAAQIKPVATVIQTVGIGINACGVAQGFLHGLRVLVADLLGAMTVMDWGTSFNGVSVRVAELLRVA